MKKKIKFNKLFTFSMITLGIFLSFKHLESSKVKISNKEFTKLITDNTYTYNPNIISQAINYVVDNNNPIKLMNTEYTKYLR